MRTDLLYITSIKIFLLFFNIFFVYNIGGKDKELMIDQEETEGIGNDFIS